MDHIQKVEGLKSKNQGFPEKKKFGFKTAALNPAASNPERASSLSAYPSQFVFASPPNCVRQLLQFFKI